MRSNLASSPDWGIGSAGILTVIATTTQKNVAAQRGSQHCSRDRHVIRRLSVRVIFVGLCLALIAVRNTPLRAETLQQALSSAYQYSPRIDAERARLRASDEDVARAMSGYRPTIIGSADVNYQRTQSGPPSRTVDNQPRGYGVDFTQPIFRGFQTRNAVSESEANVRSAREVLRNTEQAVLFDAVSAFMDVIRDQEIVRLNERNVRVLSKELSATEQRFKAGEVTRTDLAQARARRAGAVSSLDLARANLKTSRANFKQVIGHDPSGLITPSGYQRNLPRSVGEAVSIGRDENPNVGIVLFREQAARYTVARIRGELLPSVQLEANYSDRYGIGGGGGFGIDESQTTTVTGRLTVPFYQGGEVHARVRQAKHTHVSLIQEIEQARVAAEAAVVAAWSQWEASQAQLESDTIRVESNQIALAGVREEERVGQRDLLDVLNAEQEFVNAQVQLASTKRNLVVSAYALLQAIGRLDVLNVDAAHMVYDPEMHYHEVRRKWFGISITHEDGRLEEFHADPDGRWDASVK